MTKTDLELTLEQESVARKLDILWNIDNDKELKQPLFQVAYNAIRTSLDMSQTEFNTYWVAYQVKQYQENPNLVYRPGLLFNERV